MKRSAKWLIWLFVLMIISFIVSGICLLNSGLFNLDNGEINKEGLAEFEIVSEKYSNLLGFSMDLNFESCGEVVGEGNLIQPKV